MSEGEHVNQKACLSDCETYNAASKSESVTETDCETYKAAACALGYSINLSLKLFMSLSLVKHTDARKPIIGRIRVHRLSGFPRDGAVIQILQRVVVRTERLAGIVVVALAPLPVFRT